MGRRVDQTIGIKFLLTPRQKSIRGMQGCDNAFQYGEHLPCAVGVPLLEILAILSHGVGDMRETKKGYVGRTCKGVKCRCFHLDCKNSFASCSFDRLDGLPEGRI